MSPEKGRQRREKAGKTLAGLWYIINKCIQYAVNYFPYFTDIPRSSFLAR